MAVLLRGDFVSLADTLIILRPYITASLGAAFVIFFVGGLDRTSWRYSSIEDHLQIIVYSVLAVLLALVLTFVTNRLNGVARSLPVLQCGLIVILLISARSAARFWYTRKVHVNGKLRTSGQAHETILIVGVNRVSELFILSVKEFASRRAQVAGLLVEEPWMRGRTIQQTPILGTVEELQDILRSLEVHGLAVDRIVVATAIDRLQYHAVEALLEVEKSSNIVIQFLSEQLGFDDPTEKASVLSGQKLTSSPGQRSFAGHRNVIDVDRGNFTQKSFRFQKRIVDVFGAAFLTIMVAPVPKVDFCRIRD